MSTDNMQKYADLALTYKVLPLIALREIRQVLDFEINNRLESFGEYSFGKSGANSGDNVVGSVAEVEAKNVAGSVGNNVVIGNFSRGKQ